MPEDLPQQDTPPVAPPPPSPNREFAETIQKLTAQEQERERLRAEERQEERARLERLENQLAEVAKANQPKRYDPKDPLASVPDEELLTITAQGPTEENASKYAFAQEELWKRREQKLREDLARQRQEEKRQQDIYHQTERQMREHFGEDIFKEGTELNTKAKMHMRRLQQLHGDGVWNDPKAILAASSLAQQELMRVQLEKAKEMERENTQLKQRAAMERGNQSMASRSSTVDSILKGDKKPVTERERRARVAHALKAALNEAHRRNGGES